MTMQSDKQRLHRIGAAIRAARKRRRMTAKGLAAKIGTSPQILCGLEAGKNYPGGRMIIALAEALGTSADELLDLTPPPAMTPPPATISSAERQRFCDGAMSLIDGLDIR